VVSGYTFKFFICRSDEGGLEVVEEDEALIQHGVSFFEEEKYDDYVEVVVPASNWREAKDKLKRYLPLIARKLVEG